MRVEPIPIRGVASLSDDELLRRLAELVACSRRVEADLVAHIAEVDERRLYAREASPSMFAYCTDVLHLSEPEAYLRISVARAGRAYPVLLTMLREGRLHLSGIAKLAPYLTPENVDAVLPRAAHKSKRHIEEMVAELAPQPDVPARIRRLPERRVVDDPSPALLAAPPGKAPQLRPDAVPQAHQSPASPTLVRPTAPARYKVEFTASAEFRDKLERLQALMRHSVPDGDLARILEEAVTEKLERIEARRFAATKTPRKGIRQSDTAASGSRCVPAAVRRAVYGRDAAACRFAGANGRTCGARDWLEFHHVEPHGRGGDRSLANIQLLCRTHNAHHAERDYGKEVMARHRQEAGRGATVPGPPGG